MLVLRRPTPEDSVAVMAYRMAFLEAGDSLDGTANLRLAESYEDWYAAVMDNAQAETVRPGLVPATTLLAIEEGRLVGMIDIRHRLNDYLLRYGGHIGYSVHPNARRCGYANQILALGLEECRTLGLTRVLVSCDDGNIGSAQTIVKNGGELENVVDEEGTAVRRYWITL